ncbi:hypothetical protein YC2023_091883 [Brassica napus]
MGIFKLCLCKREFLASFWNLATSLIVMIHEQRDGWESFLLEAKKGKPIRSSQECVLVLFCSTMRYKYNDSYVRSLFIRSDEM